MDALPTLAQIIRGRRIELGKTQEELAEMLGMSQEWVTGIETGKILEPRMNTIALVARIMSIPVEDLVIAAKMATTKAGARRVVESTDLGTAAASGRSSMRVAQSIAEEAAEYDWDDPTMKVVMDRMSKMTPQQRRKLAELMDSLGFGNDHG